MDTELVGRNRLLGSLLEATRARRSFLLDGPAGVGKSRLLREVVGSLRPQAWAVERFVATEASRQLPFGPMITLLETTSTSDDLPRLLVNVRGRLLERAGSRPLLLAVDDAHLLDALSLALVTDLVHQQQATVALTTRSGEPLPAELSSLWSSGLVERHDVGPLDTAEAEALVVALLGHPVQRDLLDDLVQLGQGNPLLLRELVADARWSGAVVLHDGTWHRARPLSSGARVQDLIAAQVQRLDSGEKAVLELLAFGEPVPVDLLQPEEAKHLDALERRGLAVVEPGDAGLVARVHHPLVSEAMQALVPTRRRQAILRELASRFATRPTPGTGDALRVAQWSMACHDPVAPSVATTAAREALGALDLGLAGELARQALADGETFEALMVLGEVRRVEGRSDEAEAALTRAASLAADDDERTRSALALSHLLVHQLGRPADAVHLLDEVAAQVDEPRQLLDLRSASMGFSGLLGRYRDVLRSTRTILGSPEIDDERRWNVLTSAVYAQVMLADLEGFDDSLDAALGLSARLDPSSMTLDLLWALRAGAHVQRGQLARGGHEIDAHLRRARATAELTGTTGAIHLALLLYRSSPRFHAELRTVEAELAQRDPFGVGPLVAGVGALGAALTGQLDDALRLLETADLALTDPRARPFVARGHGAVLAVNGDRPAAVELVVARGLEAIESSHVAFGAIALHDAVLYGRADLVARPLRAAASGSAPLIDALAAHAESVRDGDAEAIDEVVERFATMGAPFLAASAAADAAAAHGCGRDARRAAARFGLWAQAASPFRPLSSPTVKDALSARQLEVLRLAAEGRPSRVIAEDLFLSKRTVDNHLRMAYEKLEVNGRADLAAVLGPLPEQDDLEEGR